jgi:cell division protein FtsZ
VEKFAPKDSTMPQSIALANDVLYKALSGIIEILNTEGTINVDFADIEAILECRGPAFMAFGEAAGENRAKKAFQSAITNPIMSEQSIKGAKRMLINVIGDSNILATEFEEINHLAADLGAPDAVIFSGWVIDESLSESGTIKVTVLATGLDNSQEWDKPADEVINLDTLVEEPSVSVREEAELTQQRKEPIEQGVTQVPRESEQSAWGPPPSAGTNTQQQQGVTYPQTNAPKPPVRRRPTPGGSIVPGQLSRYEQNAGVDPDNPNSVFYDTPSFLRNKAN